MSKQYILFLSILVSIIYFGCLPLSQHYTKKIIILYPIEHPSLKKIQNGFKTTLSKKFPHEKIEFIEYNGSGNRLLMHQQAEQAYLQKPDLIFAITTSSAGLATASKMRNNSSIPLVCGAADITIIKINGKLPNQTSCVFDVEDYDKQLQLLKAIRPGTKNMLIVYDQNATKNEYDLVNFIYPFSKKHDITVHTLPVETTDEINKKISLTLQNIGSIDAIMIFKDSLVVSGIEILVKLCNERGVTLYTTDIDSVARGAAAGFGVEEAQTGIESAHVAYKMLTDPQKNYDPISLVSDTLLVNPETMKQQGLALSKEQLKKTPLGYQYIEKE